MLTILEQKANAALTKVEGIATFTAIIGWWHVLNQE
jgi:hypothetical protein